MDAKEEVIEQPSSPESVSPPPPLRSDKETTEQPPSMSPPLRSDILRGVVFWRRKNLSLMVLVLATATWVLLDVYQFNFITIVSWAAISIVAMLFLWGNLLRLLGKKPPDLPGLEMSEQSTIEVANSCRGIVEEAVRWMIHVSVEREWFVFAEVVGGILSLSYIGTFTDLLTFLYIGIVMGMTAPLIYVKYDDKITRAGDQVQVKVKRLYEMVEQKIKSNKFVIKQKEKKIE
ncbi:hypothetical protein Ddye_010441 [Dipteronia dyeriana]|uniref:Reticulon-like protein n=1 Tax=Dipteronia dyeriana TaxID=168575 RepID=A0AAE0CNB5_9ROSI|nr:hypothetical protein Ddye_010436 [Dipteronia dyeriana]KAK2657389.1 hypothetical protein Ddye_010441 [Dipteronia dyeriana]